MLHIVVYFEQTINIVFHKIKNVSKRTFSAKILSSGHKNTENNAIFLKRGYKIFEMLPISLQFYSKNIQVSNVMEILPVGAELFHANGRTDRHDEANSRIWQICEGA